MDQPPAKPSETGRIEAFSDGVIAIIITIMVLELQPPEQPTLAALAKLWPVLVAYALSFLQVAIYWMNHHQLLDRACASTNGLRWANMVWLFFLSLIPLGTAWWGDHPTAPIPTAAYLASLLAPALVYPWLEREALVHAAATDASSEHHLQQHKVVASIILYTLGMLLAFLLPYASLFCVLIVAVIWVAPGGRVDRLFGSR
jgi:uncharacterized membrane protein